MIVYAGFQDNGGASELRRVENKLIEPFSFFLSFFLLAFFDMKYLFILRIFLSVFLFFLSRETERLLAFIAKVYKSDDEEEKNNIRNLI